MDRLDNAQAVVPMDPPRPDEAGVRAMLETSVRNIAQGQVVPLEPILAQMHTTADRVRREQTGIRRRVIDRA